MKTVKYYNATRLSSAILPVVSPATDRGLKQRAVIFVTLFIAVMIFLSSCANIGPDMVARERFDYTAALSDSWKEQMLLNLVKLRYGDTPIFLDVASIISSYELSGSTSLGGEWKFNPAYESGASIGASGFFANRPTITYSPLSGEKFAKSLMTPVPTSAVFHLIQSGDSADLVFRVLVQSVNGVKNRYGSGSTPEFKDPRFYELTEKIKRIQDFGTLGLKVQKLNGEETMMVVFGGATDEDTEAAITDVKKILGLAPQPKEFRVVYGLVPADDTEVAVLSRSVLQVLSHLASYIEVLESHVAEKRTYPTNKNEPVNGVSIPPLIRIHSSVDKPVDVFFAVPYHQYWFWIDDKDLSSKQIFSFMMFIFTLVEPGGKEGTPVVTVPVR